MRKLLQELYEYDSLRKQASTPGAPASTTAPGAPASTTATTPASTGTQASTQPPTYNPNQGVVYTVPATKMTHITPAGWSQDSKLQYMMDMDGRGFIRMITPASDGSFEVKKTWRPGDKGFENLMKSNVLPSPNSSDFEGPAMKTRLGILRVVGKPTGLTQQKWKDGHWVDFRTASPDDNFNTWHKPATTTSTQLTDEDIQAFNQAYAAQGGVIPEQLDDTKAPAEKWYNDPRVQQKALWSTGIGLATALGGYALTGGRGGIAPWLLGGIGIGGGVGGMLGYKDWTDAAEQYKKNSEQWKAYNQALNEYQNEKKKQIS